MLSRINEVIGNSSPVLTEVLSYFPEKAELFIRTQEYASRVGGRRGVWFTVQHKSNDQRGVLGNELYSKGHWEHLGVRGFTGEYLLKYIGEIKKLRGQAGHDVYFGSDYLDQILEIYQMQPDQMDEDELMIKKAMEVMRVNDEEIHSLRNYVEATEKAQDLVNRAGMLKSRAKLLEDEASRILADASIKIEQTHFKSRINEADENKGLDDSDSADGGLA